MNDHPQSERSQLEHFAIADMLNLLSMFVAPTTRELAEGVSRGSVGRDVDAIFAHLGIGFDGTPSEGLTTLQGGSLAEENLFSEMRRSHTKLFSHPTQPLVSPYESSFVGMRDSPSTPQPLSSTKAPCMQSSATKRPALRSRARNRASRAITWPLNWSFSPICTCASARR